MVDSSLHGVFEIHLYKIASWLSSVTCCFITVKKNDENVLHRLNDELLHCVLKTVVRESCLLITKCQTVARDDFQKLLSTVPVWTPLSASSKWCNADRDLLVLKTWLNFNVFFPPPLKVVSPSLRYLMAVQNHLLSNTILICPDESDDSDSSLQGETMKVQVNISFNYPYLCAVCRDETNKQSCGLWRLCNLAA